MVIAATVANACDSATTSSPVATLSLVPFAQNSVRLTQRDEIALVADTAACVVDSYESTVVCYDPQGAELGDWGKEGEGPGEFPKGGPRDLLSMANGRLGAWSPGYRRLSVFQVDGVHIADFGLPVPGVFSGGPMAFHTDTEGSDRFWLTAVSPTGEASFATYEFDLATQRVVWEHASETVEGAEPCEDTEGALRPGAIRANGSLHYFSCHGGIVHLPDPQGDGRVFVAKMPTYREEYPSEREVASRRRAMRFLGPTLADHIDEYRRTPKLFPALSESARAYDTDGNFWVGTRATSDSSEVDVYAGTHFIGTVRIRGALLGLDIRGSIMVALVDRRSGLPDTIGIPERGVDWYDISRAVPLMSRPVISSGEEGRLEELNEDDPGDWKDQKRRLHLSAAGRR